MSFDALICSAQPISRVAAKRIERALKEVFDPEAPEHQAASRAFVEKVRELGLQPFVQPEPLPVIDEDEIALVCWMAVESTGS